MSIQPRLALAAGAAALLLSLSQTAAMAADEGLKVVRDPVTGALRAPTAEESRKLDSPAATEARGVLSGRLNPPVVRHANGMKSVELTSQQTMYSVVTRNADGTLQKHCVSSAEQSERLASGQITSFAKTMMERANEQ
jgi:hypothetical protein